MFKIDNFSFVISILSINLLVCG